TTDKLADIAFSVQVGMGVLRARSNRTLVPTTYPSYTLPDGAKARLGAVDAVSSEPGDDPVMLFTDPHVPPALVHILLHCTIAPVVRDASVGYDPDDVVGDLIAANVIEGPASPCPDLVAGAGTAHGVTVWSPCRVENGEVVWASPGAERFTIQVPADAGEMEH